MSIEPTPTELRDAFAAQLQTLPPAPDAARYRPRTGRGPWPLAVAAGVLAVVAGVTIAVAARPGGAPPPSAVGPGSSASSISSTVDNFGSWAVLAAANTPVDLGCEAVPGVRVYIFQSDLTGIDTGSVCLAAAGSPAAPAGASPITIGGNEGWTWTVGGTVVAAMPVEIDGQPYFALLVSGPADGAPNLLNLQQILSGMVSTSIEPTPCNGSCG